MPTATAVKGGRRLTIKPKKWKKATKHTIQEIDSNIEQLILMKADIELEIERLVYLKGQRLVEIEERKERRRLKKQTQKTVREEKHKKKGAPGKKPKTEKDSKKPTKDKAAGGETPQHSAKSTSRLAARMRGLTK